MSEYVVGQEVAPGLVVVPIKTVLGWEEAMREYGYEPITSLSPKEQLYEFAEWWFRMKKAGN